MFSSLPEDESLDDVKPQRIKLDRSIYEEPVPRQRSHLRRYRCHLRQEDMRRSLQNLEQSLRDR